MKYAKPLQPPKVFKKEFIFVAGFLLFFLAFILFKSPLFQIKNIQIEGVAPCISSDELKRSLALQGESIFFFKEQKVEEAINKFPCLGSIKVNKNFPSTLSLKLQPRKPIANISAYSPLPKLSFDNPEATPSSQSALLDWSFPSAGDIFQIDSQGVIFGKGFNNNLPSLFIDDGNLNLGKHLDGEIFSKIDSIFKKIGGSGIRAKISDNYLMVEEGQRIVFSLDKDLNQQLASLQLILQTAKMNSKLMNFIDLRFDKPVIVYSSEKKN